jgi:hypothetical protein
VANYLPVHPVLAVTARKQKNSRGQHPQAGCGKKKKRRSWRVQYATNVRPDQPTLRKFTNNAALQSLSAGPVVLRDSGINEGLHRRFQRRVVRFKLFFVKVNYNTNILLATRAQPFFAVH